MHLPNPSNMFKLQARISSESLVFISPSIFVVIEKVDSDATVDTGGVSRSRVILNSTGKVDS